VGEWVSGWGGVDGVGGGWAKVTMGPAAVPKEPSMVSKPHYKAKQAFDNSHG